MKANTWIAKKYFHAYLLGHCCPLCQEVFYQHRPGEKSGPPLMDVACEYCGVLFRESLGESLDFAETDFNRKRTDSVFAGHRTQ
ncbi:MAG TPA: hypothetical protein VIL66_02310 [Bacillota bacterium]